MDPMYCNKVAQQCIRVFNALIVMYWSVAQPLPQVVQLNLETVAALVVQYEYLIRHIIMFVYFTAQNALVILEVQKAV